MKLTKLQRHTAYILMLADVQLRKQRGWDAYLCHVFSGMQSYSVHSDLEILSRELPELFFKKRPKGVMSGDAWFDPFEYDKRIELLQQCIAETY